MRKATALMLIALMMMCSTVLTVEAAPRGEKYRVTVMEFGTYQELDIDNLRVAGSEKSMYEMVVNSLLDTKRFSTFELERDRLDEAQINYKGKIAKSDVKKIGEIQNVPYLICGSVMDIAPIESECMVLSNGLKVYSVRAEIMMVMVDATDGKYIRSAIGAGTSSSAHVKVGNDLHTFNIGSTKVAQSSVVSALLKASEDAVEKLVSELGSMKK